MCLPPSKSVERNVFAISLAFSKEIMRAPRQRTFASLWCLVSDADSVSEQRAARIPLCLFAAMLIPIPVPQTSIPNLHSPEFTSLHTLSAYTG